MNILITGHEGFIGRNMLAWMHQQEGWNVEGWEWDPKEFPDVTAYDWVVHLGAIADMTESDVDAVMKQNYSLVRNCLTSVTIMVYIFSTLVLAVYTAIPKTSANMLQYIRKLHTHGASICSTVGYSSKSNM
jgi:hypothetical protein